MAVPGKVPTKVTVIGFGLVGVAESVGDPVVKILNTLVRFLSQILKQMQRALAEYLGA